MVELRMGSVDRSLASSDITGIEKSHDTPILGQERLQLPSSEGSR